MKKLINVLSILWGRSPSPGLWAGGNKDFDVVLRAAARYPNPKWRGTTLEIAAPYIAQFMWYVKAPFEITGFLRHYGTATAKDGGPTLFGQVKELVKLAYVNRVSFEIYYRYRSADAVEGAALRDFIQGSTCSTIVQLINKTDIDMLNDKQQVAEKLQDNGSTVVPTWVSVFAGHVDISPEFIDQTPAANMILKPNDGMQGEGVELVKFVAANKYEFRDQTVTFEELLQQLKKISNHRRYLLQPCLRNHQALRHFAPNSLSTLRILTGQRTDKSVEAVAGILRVGPLGKVLDNFSVGGLAAPIDLETGIAGLGRGEGILSKPERLQLNSSNVIAGTAIPFWSEALQACCAAHSVFSDYVFLGWDVAITDQGPVLIEANVGWCCKIMQMPDCVPLGQTSFASIARQAMDAANLP